ncbi:MAG: hypothetical protein QOE45_2132 [Frankiaceae bacterium]|nr:hypothetical protein [Frankiaceae bacterium]
MTLRPLALAVLLCLPAPARAATPPPPREARWAATWLADRIGSNGAVTALDGKADPATTVVVGLALAAAGTAPKTLDAAATYLGNHIDEYARANNADRPGALGRLAMLAAASGRDPNAFGGTAPTNHLIDRILATRTLAGPNAGMFADPMYSGVFSHALGLLGVATALTLTTDQQAAVTSALDFLVAQQCADGAWQNAARVVVAGIALTQCGTGANGPDTNTASLAAQALAAFRRAARTDPLQWLDAAQNAAGGYGYLPGGATDADSTALAVQAIVASGGSPTSARFTTGRTSAYAALLALQVRCAGPAKDRGAFAYQRGSDGSLKPNLYATAEAVPAIALKPFPLTRPAATVARMPVPCTHT